MTGHAGASVSTVLGLQSGDELLGEKDRHAVAVIGDGAFPSGVVYEALNNAAGQKQKALVILNDNKMSICPRVGGVADYFDRLRTAAFYTGFKQEVVKQLNKVPLLGDPVERLLSQIKEGIKAGLHGGMFFEDLGFRYIGPIDGHDISLLRKYLKMVKDQDGPTLLHVVTEKGHGYQPAAADPVYFHTPPAFENRDGQPVPKPASSKKAYTNVIRDAIAAEMRRNPKVTVMTAAMCQGNKLEPVRDEFPTRFFDTGICEAHTVAFAAGQAKAGMRPIVNIYSTFLQRSFDHIFQEVSLQNLPVVFTMDRAGLAGPDGPTHHGVFDIGYMRMFPHMISMAPGDALDVAPMLEFALAQSSPTSLRYPKANADEIERDVAPIELGKAEIIQWGADGTIICCGALLGEAIGAAQLLKEECDLDVGVVNARFIKPLDRDILRRALSETGFVVTVEEGVLMTGFGSAVLEAAGEMGLDTRRLRRLGIPDSYVQHAERGELLAELGLGACGISRACREMSNNIAQFSRT
jgi:1-deoxy-D-xylulose-5-phosphate synthase